MGLRFSTFLSLLIVEHSQIASAVGTVISFDFVILSKSTTMLIARAPEPRRQMSCISGRMQWDRSKSVACKIAELGAKGEETQN